MFRNTCQNLTLTCPRQLGKCTVYFNTTLLCTKFVSSPVMLYVCVQPYLIATSWLNFKLFFFFFFTFLVHIMKDKDQRSMDLETAQAMLTLLLGRQWPLFSQFYQFLEQAKYKVINKDQWCNILEFSRAIKPDLSNYDEDGACKFKGIVQQFFSL